MKAAKILPFHFLLMTLFGIWCPDHWPSFRRNLRNLYMLVVIVVIFSLISMQLARLVFVRLSLDEFNDTLYIAIATCGACFKFSYYLAHREQVSRLIDMFQVSRCLVRDDFERDIKSRYDAGCTLVAKWLVTMVWTCVVAMIATPLSAGPAARQLPHEVMQVYSLSSPLAYWSSFAHHSCAAFFIAGTSIVSDAIVAGFMSQLCAQFDLMAHRLQLLPQQARAFGSVHAEDVETSLLRDNVQHHVYCYEIAESITRTFKGLIVAQFYASTIQICLSVYQLAFRATNTVEFLNYFSFLVCMLFTLAIYCYFGNELTHKSKQFCDAIFETDWMSLTVKSRRSLVFMILRASKPIEISDGTFVRLNMQTFGAVVKVSYSAFNVMRRS